MRIKMSKDEFKELIKACDARDLLQPPERGEIGPYPILTQKTGFGRMGKIGPNRSPRKPNCTKIGPGHDAGNPG